MLPAHFKQIGQTVSGSVRALGPGMKLGNCGQLIKLSWSPVHTVQHCVTVSSTVAALIATLGMLGGAGALAITLIS